MNRNKIAKRTTAVLCILLILACASALLLPHSHESDGGVHNCIACAFIKSLGFVGAIVGHCFILFFLKNTTCRTFDAFREALILHDGAPVWLKTKLSN